jgi:hypothetical protein
MYTVNFYNTGIVTHDRRIGPGTDVMILKIFSPKKLAIILVFFCSNSCYFLQKFDHNIMVYEKNANFFAENLQKSPKIVIKTSIPGRQHMLLM